LFSQIKEGRFYGLAKVGLPETRNILAAEKSTHKNLTQTLKLGLTK
jgi:hypothetical protein